MRKFIDAINLLGSFSASIDPGQNVAIKIDLDKEIEYKLQTTIGFNSNNLKINNIEKVSEKLADQSYLREIDNELKNNISQDKLIKKVLTDTEFFEKSVNSDVDTRTKEKIITNSSEYVSAIRSSDTKKINDIKTEIKRVGTFNDKNEESDKFISALDDLKNVSASSNQIEAEKNIKIRKRRYLIDTSDIMCDNDPGVYAWGNTYHTTTPGCSAHEQPNYKQQEEIKQSILQVFDKDFQETWKNQKEQIQNQRSKINNIFNALKKYNDHLYGLNVASAVILSIIWATSAALFIMAFWTFGSTLADATVLAIQGSIATVFLKKSWDSYYEYYDTQKMIETLQNSLDNSEIIQVFDIHDFKADKIKVINKIIANKNDFWNTASIIYTSVDNASKLGAIKKLFEKTVDYSIRKILEFSLNKISAKMSAKFGSKFLSVVGWDISQAVSKMKNINNIFNGLKKLISWPQIIAFPVRTVQELGKQWSGFALKMKANLAIGVASKIISIIDTVVSVTSLFVLNSLEKDIVKAIEGI